MAKSKKGVQAEIDRLKNMLDEYRCANEKLKQENEAYRGTLFRIHASVRDVLGVEEAAAAREAADTDLERCKRLLERFNKEFVDVDVMDGKQYLVAGTGQHNGATVFVFNEAGKFLYYETPLADNSSTKRM